MSGKGNDAYEKLNRELGEKYGGLYQRLDLNTPGVRYAPSKPEREFKPYQEQEDGTVTAKTMADVLAAHWSASTHTERKPFVDKCDGCGAVIFSWGDPTVADGYERLAAHQAAALSAAGFGLVADAKAEAWAEGFEAGTDWGEWAAAPVREEPADAKANPYKPTA